MSIGEPCESCNNLRELASAAIHRHVHTIGRREMAKLQHDADLVASLDPIVEEAAEARRQAVAAYKTHLEWHRAGQLPAAAKSAG